MLFRKVVRDALAAGAGRRSRRLGGRRPGGLEKIDQLKPDAITLDLEMPESTAWKCSAELHERAQPARRDRGQRADRRRRDA